MICWTIFLYFHCACAETAGYFVARDTFCSDINHFVIRHVHKMTYFHFLSETFYHYCSQRRRFGNISDDFDHFPPSVHGNGYLWTSVQNAGTTIHFGDHDSWKMTVFTCPFLLRMQQWQYFYSRSEIFLSGVYFLLHINLQGVEC